MKNFLLKLKESLSATELKWFDDSCSTIKVSAGDKELFFAFSMTQRKIARKELAVDQKIWYTDELVRLHLLLAKNFGSADAFYQRFEKIFITADSKESIALLKGLSFYPFSQGILNKASEGLRSNVVGIFKAVSLLNDFPQKYFDEMTWNQMILKSLFIESPLYQIKGIDDKNNLELNRMLCDYALERIAASRSIVPELWRCVTSVSDERIFKEWEKLFVSGSEIEKSAVGLISKRLSEEISSSYSTLINIKVEELVYKTWHAIGEALEIERKVI